MTTHTTSSAPATALKSRMDHWSVAPALIQGLLDLQQVADSAGIERSLHFLLTLRVSQINGCAFCMNMHSAEAKAHGESDQRLFLLSPGTRPTSSVSANAPPSTGRKSSRVFRADTFPPPISPPCAPSSANSKSPP